MSSTPTVLLTGASGYIGGRLLPLLIRRELKVRCVARRPEFLRGRVAAGIEVNAGDVTTRSSLDLAMSGVHTAYYLVHSMGGQGSYEELDRLGAENFAQAASAAGVSRIIYLGGLGDRSAGLSTHLSSRHEVGDVLRKHAGRAQVLEFRASIVIGSGSASFEMIRALVERLPVMVTPRWVSVLAQPIAVEDVVAYLISALDQPLSGHRIFEIGGRDILSYRDIMYEYARQRGLTRYMIPVPVLTPRLSSLWLGLVTPLYARVGRQLVDSLRNPTVVNDQSAFHEFQVRPLSVSNAIARALQNEDRARAETSWTDAVSSATTVRDWGGTRFGNRLVDSRTVQVSVESELAFAAILRIGGDNGWHFGNWLWQLRGWLDLVVGGVGMRRGRRDPDYLATGDTLDCWRVEACETPNRLLLVAEMKLPGRAWLEFVVTRDGSGSVIRQTAIFDPVGFLGLVYWYAAYPLHEVVFRGMLSGIARAAGRLA